MLIKFIKSFIVCIVVLFVSCEGDVKTIKSVQVKSIDSLWQHVKEAKEDDNKGFRKVIDYYWSMVTKSPKELDYFYSLIENEANSSLDSEWIQSEYLLKSWIAGSNGDIAGAEKYLNKMNTDNIELNLSRIQQFGYLYYTKNTLDTVIYFYKKGYQIAKDANHKNWLLNFSNNLGTVYYDYRELDLASKYFKEAIKYADEINVKVPMLYNNIITCALGLNGNEDAFALYEKYKDDFKSDVPYENIIYNLNHANLLMKKHQYDEAEKILKNIDTTNIDENVLGMYDVQYAHLYFVQQKFDMFEGVFSKYKVKIFENPEIQLPNWNNLIKDGYGIGLQTLKKSELLALYNQDNIQKNVRLKNYVAELLLAVSKNTSDESKWKITALSTQLDLVKIHDVNFQNDMLLNFKLSSLTAENDRIKYQVKLKESENNQYILALIGIVLVAILAAVLFMFYFKNRKIEIEKLRLEINNSRHLNEINKNKRVFADRLISSNHAMVKKLNLIIKNIQKSKFAKDPEIIQIKHELTSLTEIEEDLFQEMDQLKATDVLMFISDKFHCINEMNQTEKIILGYLLNGQKIKDIAVLMSISEQHARNTKTRVLKLMSQETNSIVTMEKLLQIKDAFGK